MLAAASIWVAGPVLLKLLSDVHSSSRVAFMTACTILILSGLYAFRAQSRSGQWLQDLTIFVWGIAMLGAVPALIIGGLMRTDAVSVALIGGWFIFLVPALAWLLRKQELDGGFFLVFVFASAGICTSLYGRIRWAEATILGDLLLIVGTVALVFGFMRAPQGAGQEQAPLRTTIVQVSGAALFFTGLAAASNFNWFRLITADEFPLFGILAAAFAAYWSTTYWAKHEFNWNEWPILFLAALFLIGVVLAKIVFAEALNTGEMICGGLVTIMVSTTHWLRRWLRS
ncbi:MAG: hypothetical protein ACSHYC_25120 [Alphaproteobacteria bacterium]